MTKQSEQGTEPTQGHQAPADFKAELAPPAAELAAGALDPRSAAPGDPSPPAVEAHAARLGDSRIPTVQRQGYALRVGRRYGNQYLQRVVAAVPSISATQPAGTVARDYGPAHHELLDAATVGGEAVPLIFRVDPDAMEMEVRPDQGASLPAGLTADQVEELLSLHRHALSDEAAGRRRVGSTLVYSLVDLTQVDWDMLAARGMVESDQIPVEEAVAGAERVEELEFGAAEPVGPIAPPAERPWLPPGERIYQPTTAAYGGPIVGQVTESYSTWDPRHARRTRPRAERELAAFRTEQAEARAELERLEQQAESGSLSPRQARRRRFLRTRMRELPRQIASRERDVAPAPPQERFGNIQLIEVDLTASGVQIKNASGRVMGTNQTRLDPVFAQAMMGFLRMLASDFSVRALRTAAFNRPPISADDPHPLGQACDIVGFETRDGEEILLRSGNRVLHDEANFDQEHSDWFDNHQTIRGTRRTHMRFMRDIADRMPQFFGSITGPGANELHMNHFHVQLIGYRGRAGALDTPATITDPRPFERRRSR